MLDVTQFTANTLERIEKMLMEFKKLQAESENIRVNFDIGDKLISIQHIKMNTGFYFNITKPKPEQNSKELVKAITIEYLPQHANSITSYRVDVALDQPIKSVQSWLNVLKKYEAVDLNKYKGDFAKTFEHETYEDFKILDDDAYYAPFDEPRRLFWHNYLNYVVEELKKEDNPERPEIQEMISQVEELNRNIETLTKNEVVTWYSKIMGKAKKHGTKFALDVLDVAKKEVIKYYLKAAYNELPSLMQSVHEFMNHSPHTLLS